jgi:hypothetical protein
MSRSRMVNKLRTNDDFKAITAELDARSLPYEVSKPTGSGHPSILITMPNGDVLRHHVTCTPRGGGNPRGALAFLRRALAKFDEQ